MSCIHAFLLLTTFFFASVSIGKSFLFENCFIIIGCVYTMEWDFKLSFNKYK